MKGCCGVRKTDNAKLMFLIYAVVTLFLMFCLTSGCGKGVGASPSIEYREFVDYQGTRVKIPKKPKRVLTLALSFDVMAMGVVPPERFVAVNAYASDPGISCIVKESAVIEPKLQIYPLETVLKLKPDLIIASTWTRPEMIDCYRDVGFNVIVLKGPNTIEEVEQDIKMLADALGEEESGQKVLTEMHKQLKEIDSTLAKLRQPPPVGMLVSQMTSYGGKGCMFDVLCTRARVTNGITKMGLINGQYVPKELVVACDPDFFMLSATRQQSTVASKKFQQAYLKDPALTGLRGLQNISFIPDRNLYSASQNCVYAIKGIANNAYGQIFDLRDEHLIKGY